jgi:hypothetical protein
MTRRERIEAKLEKREEWAEGRAGKAAALRARNEPFRGDYAFNTQPGHIPERARVIRRTEKAWEHDGMAAHHRGKAAGLKRMLDETVFSDDPDAVEALEARIAEREAERNRVKRFNATARKGKPDYSILTEEERADLLRTAQVAAWQLGKGGGFPPYKLAYLGAQIKKDRERIAQVKAQQARTARAEAAGGVLVEGLPGSDWCSVTFDEKPSRELINKLKTAGFWWRGGSWHGKRADLPEEVSDGS